MFGLITGKEEERAMFQQMQAMAQKQVSSSHPHETYSFSSNQIFDIKLLKQNSDQIQKPMYLKCFLVNCINYLNQSCLEGITIENLDTNQNITI